MKECLHATLVAPAGNDRLSTLEHTHAQKHNFQRISRQITEEHQHVAWQIDFLFRRKL